MGTKARPAVPAILDVLHDPKSYMRVRAATTLIEMDVQSKAALATLRQELKAEDAADRASAASVIGYLVDPPEILGTFCWGPGPPPRVARPWVGKRTLPALVAALGDPNAKVRTEVANTLGIIGHDAARAVPALRKAVKDPDVAVREAVARAIRKVKP